MARYRVFTTYQETEYLDVEADTPEAARERADASNADWTSCQDLEYVSGRVEELS